MENLNYKTTTTLTLTVEFADGDEVSAHTTFEFDTVGDDYDKTVCEKTKMLYDRLDPYGYVNHTDLTLYLEIMTENDSYYHDYDKEAVIDVVNNNGTLEIHEDIFNYAKHKQISDELYNKIDNFILTMTSGKCTVGMDANCLLTNELKPFAATEFISSFYYLNNNCYSNDVITIQLTFNYNGKPVDYTFTFTGKYPNFSNNIELAELLTKAIDDNQKNSEEQ